MFFLNLAQLLITRDAVIGGLSGAGLTRVGRLVFSRGPKEELLEEAAPIAKSRGEILLDKYLTGENEPTTPGVRSILLEQKRKPDRVRAIREKLLSYKGLPPLSSKPVPTTVDQILFDPLNNMEKRFYSSLRRAAEKEK